MDSMHDALIKRMRNFGLDKAITATVIIEAANRILPPEVRAMTFHKGVLTVQAQTGTDAYMLKQELDDSIERINAALAQKPIESIRIRIRHQSS
jgi:hypothetical protein